MIPKENSLKIFFTKMQHQQDVSVTVVISFHIGHHAQKKLIPDTLFYQCNYMLFFLLSRK